MHTSNTEHDETLKDHLDNDKAELQLKSQLINALQVFDILPYEQDSKYGSGKANKEDYWRICNKAIDQYTQSKLKAFAGEVEASIGIHLSIDKSHACRFNDGEQNCDCFINGRNDLRDDFREALKAIKEKAGIE